MSSKPDGCHIAVKSPLKVALCSPFNYCGEATLGEITAKIPLKEAVSIAKPGSPGYPIGNRGAFTPS
ncbi:hypothetical protein [Rhodoblastus sp.]|uniref:hypothetical protein n=1 Tax=Rhodoblastus sp. TaxID=1962975 RepID=UPI003FD8F6A3